MCLEAVATGLILLDQQWLLVRFVIPEIVAHPRRLVKMTEGRGCCLWKVATGNLSITRITK